MSKSDLSVRSDIRFFKKMLVSRIMLMSVCSRSNIHISKSDFSVRSDIIVSVLSVRSDINLILNTDI